MTKRCTVRDVITTVSKREITPQGYLVAPAVIGRTGVQVYTRGELGLDGDPRALLRLMRTADEVFRPETIASFENVPVTDNHPPEMVTSENWARYSKGEVRDVGKQEDNLLGGKTLVKDGGMVAKVASGKSALSCGYSFNLDLTPGEGFDGYQRDILGDHVAIVDAPRGGPICRIGDENHEQEIHMSTRKIAADGLPPFEIDELAAGTIENHIKALAHDRDAVIKDFSDAVDAHKAKTTAQDAELVTVRAAIAAKDAELVALKAELAAAKAVDIDALVTERAQVVTDAHKMAPDIEPKGSSLDIRKAAIVAACGDATNKTVADAIFGGQPIEKATPDQIKGAFATLLALPRQAALAAQDAAIAASLGGGRSQSVGSGGEVFRGMDDYKENTLAKAST